LARDPVVNQPLPPPPPPPQPEDEEDNDWEDMLFGEEREWMMEEEEQVREQRQREREDRHRERENRRRQREARQWQREERERIRQEEIQRQREGGEELQQLDAIVRDRRRVPAIGHRPGEGEPILDGLARYREAMPGNRREDIAAALRRAQVDIGRDLARAALGRQEDERI
jgi:hypothetical protein